MMKGLMDHCASYETVLGHLREKVEVREKELRELTAWKEVQVNKLDLTRKLLEESEAQVEAKRNTKRQGKGNLGGQKSTLSG